MTGWALGLGIAAALSTVLAVTRVRRPVFAAAFTMMVGWLVSELAVFHLVAQVVVAVILVAGGATDSVAGVVGVVLLFASALALVPVQVVAGRAGRVTETALQSGLGDALVRVPPPAWSRRWRPFAFGRRGIEVVRDVAYGDHGRRNRLDAYRPAGTLPGAGLPVFVYVHGGGWAIGNKRQQGQPLLRHLARRGWLAIAINYRLAPRHRWPAQIVDVKRALAWIHAHAAELGGDSSFLVLGGGSAGGHLTALAALTPGSARWQPGFVEADTSVSAAVPIYGPCDLTDRAGIRGRAALRWFLERVVMTTRLRDDPDGWEAASPQFQVSPAAPPLFVVQGGLDNLVWREEARAFVAAARAVSRAPVLYAEVPGAHHAFDVFNSVRSLAAVDAIACFLETVRARADGADRGAVVDPGSLVNRP